jgi:hypothetical protein
MSRAETPLQYYERMLAAEEESVKNLNRSYREATSRADYATGQIKYLKGQLKKIANTVPSGHVQNNPQAYGDSIGYIEEIKRLERVIEEPRRILAAIDSVEESIQKKIKLIKNAKSDEAAFAASVIPKAVRERDAWAEGVDPRGLPLPLRSDAEHKAAKPSFFGRLGSFFGRKAAPAVPPRAPSNARAERQREENAGSLAGSPSYYRPPAGPLIRPSAAARAARYAEEPYVDPYSSARYGGKTKRRHRYLRKSRKSSM